MNLVVVESPYAGDIEENVKYARRAMADCLSRGEAPFASHLFYTQEGVLDDSVREQRSLGINAGFAWAPAAPVRRFYVDRGWSSGMQQGYEEAVRLGQRIEMCVLDSIITNHTYHSGLANVYIGGAQRRMYIVPPHCPPTMPTHGQE